MPDYDQLTTVYAGDKHLIELKVKAGTRIWWVFWPGQKSRFQVWLIIELDLSPSFLHANVERPGRFLKKQTLEIRRAQVSNSINQHLKLISMSKFTAGNTWQMTTTLALRRIMIRPEVPRHLQIWIAFFPTLDLNAQMYVFGVKCLY